MPNVCLCIDHDAVVRTTRGRLRAYELQPGMICEEFDPGSDTLKEITIKHMVR
jgi:hypothetical protein